MPRKKLTVHKEGYTVYKDVKRGKGKKMKRVKVPPTTFKIEDRGDKGRGKKVIPPLKEDSLTNYAIRKRYIKKGQKIGDIPLNKMDDFARDAAWDFGARKAWGKFHAQVVLRKRQEDGFKKKMMKARDTISKEIGWIGTKKKGNPKYKAKTIRRKHWKTGKTYDTTIYVKK